MTEYYAPIDPDALKRARARARALRDTPWWKRRIATGICYYCRRQVGRLQLTMDHIVPLARGGKSIRGNVVPCCGDCNTRKKSMLPVEWTEYVQALGDASED
jgi:5-methylcytosine-specific restriction endonuclease McrA